MIIRGADFVNEPVRNFVMESRSAPPPGYFSDYDNNMFLMLRDYLPLVPKEFVDNTAQGVLDFVLDGEVSSDENIFNVSREDMTI